MTKSNQISNTDIKPDNTWYNFRSNFIDAYFSLEFINVEDMLFERWRDARHIAKSLINLDGDDIKIIANELKGWRTENGGGFPNWRMELLAMANDLLFTFEPANPDVFFKGDEVNVELFNDLDGFWEAAYCTKYWIDIAKGRRERKHSDGNQPWLADIARDHRDANPPQQLELF